MDQQVSLRVRVPDLDLTVVEMSHVGAGNGVEKQTRSNCGVRVHHAMQNV